MLQLGMLKPSWPILDETDSGLDIDALRVVAEGVNALRDNDRWGSCVITHYQRILNYITPDKSCTSCSDGRIVKLRRARTGTRSSRPTGYDPILRELGELAATATT